MDNEETKQGHLPVYGVGPIYGGVIFVITVAAAIVGNMEMLSFGKIPALKLPCMIIGIVLIVSAVIIWVRAVFLAKVGDGILSNSLVTTGIYASVRNPIYSALMVLCTGILLVAGNVCFYVLPILYWLFMTILMKNTEERWLLDLYGQEYEEYCKQVNRCIPGIPYKDRVYETKISDARWIAYDLPGNVGWILYYIMLILSFVKRPAYMDDSGMFGLMELAVIPALLMLVGLIELISERIHKLDRVLTRQRLVRGFGMLTLGGILGMMVSLALLIYGRLAASGNLTYVVWMLVGSILETVFVGLLYKGYQRQ